MALCDKPVCPDPVWKLSRPAKRCNPSLLELSLKHIYSVGLGSINSISTWFGTLGVGIASIIRAHNPCWTELLVT